MQEFAPVSDRIVRELEDICGVSQVIAGDAGKLYRYSHDQVAGKEYARLPEVVVKPGSAAEISAVLRLANRERIAVTPRGAGSGLSGGAVPLYGGILLSVERMNRIIEIDRENLVAVVEPGVVTNAFDAALAEYGLFFAGYPMSEEFCFLGGNVAENAGGGRAIKYGVTSRYILGLEVVLPSGEITTFGGKRLKDVSGYDMVHLLTGSEGTLGIFTRIFIRLMPRPAARETAVAFFPDVASAIAVIPNIMTEGGIVPTSIELLDRLCLHDTCRILRETLPYHEAGAMLLFETDSAHAGEAKRDMDAILEIVERSGGRDTFRAAGPEEAERLWKIRKQVPWALRQYGEQQSLEDIVVPVGKIPEMVERTAAVAAEFGVLIPVFGHAGDGNLHAHPIKPPGWSDEEWKSRLPSLLTSLYREAASLGGTISGEHGIGHKRARYLDTVLDPVAIELMRRIKTAFDPNGILNPGKIFPD